MFLSLYRETNMCSMRHHGLVGDGSGLLRTENIPVVGNNPWIHLWTFVAFIPGHKMHVAIAS